MTLFLLRDGCISSLLPLTASDDILKHQYILVPYWFMPGCSVWLTLPPRLVQYSTSEMYVSLSPDFIEPQAGLGWKEP